MPKYRKKPVVIEAERFDGQNMPSLARQANLDNGDGKPGNPVVFLVSDLGPENTYHLSIRTLEGTMRGEKGDWLIRGVNGEVYPCKDDIFRKTYDEVDE